MFDLPDLTPDVRQNMLAELQSDIDTGRVYDSPRLSPRGQLEFVALLQDAFAGGTPESLTGTLEQPGLFNATEVNRLGVTRRMARNAPELLAQGQFVSYYMRGVAMAALTRGDDHVVIYRARESRSHRPESDAQDGTAVDAAMLLETLRTNTLSPGAVNLPDVNSGMCVRLS